MRYRLCHYLHLVFSTTLIVGLSGCTPQEKQNAVSVLQTFLNDYTQNRGLVEQAVFDVKRASTPSEPAYQRAQESYDTARDLNNQLLDQIEAGALDSRSIARSSVSADDVRNAAVDFLEDSTSALEPGTSARRLRIQRAIVMPDDPGNAMNRLPKHIRRQIIQQFDRQLRWRAWSQL